MANLYFFQLSTFSTINIIELVIIILLPTGPYGVIALKNKCGLPLSPAIYFILFCNLKVFKLNIMINLLILLSENFHHMFSLLSQLKISVLDSHKKDAKQKYNDALKAYVTRYFGRPLEKLNVSIQLII